MGLTKSKKVFCNTAMAHNLDVGSWAVSLDSASADLGGSSVCQLVVHVGVDSGFRATSNMQKYSKSDFQSGLAHSTTSSWSTSELLD